MQETSHSNHPVRIHLDRKVYESPNPTTGVALYMLGHLESRKLFCEIDGNHEDEFIPNDATIVHLKGDQHFYSQIEFTVVVNAQQKVVRDDVLTYSELIALAFVDPPTGSDVTFTISYRNGPQSNPEGTVVESRSVRVKDGMIFNVTSTDKS
ncbi:MAG TPA: multiubiquitin domain-containing protein [Patescibacteria group bacterium]|nr:multiubiquitin domain-containing protein [Patescibacteria group bacterium]